MCHIKKVMFLMVVGLILWLPLQSATITGYVSDVSSGNVLPAARLSISENMNVEFSNKKGTFTFSGLKPGNYFIKVHCENYIPMEYNVTVTGKEPYRLDVKLLKDTLFQHEVLVTGTKTNHTVGDIPVAGEVITHMEIQDRNLKNVQDVFDAMSGVRVRRTAGTWGNKGNIELQGMDAGHTLILVDGQKYYGGHNSVDIASIPVNMIRKIEVVKGPSSVLYGSDAMGGVVNIITHNGLDRKNSIKVGSTFGSNSTEVYEATASYNYKRFGATLAFTKKNSDGIERDTDKIAEDILTGKLQYRFSRNLILSVAPRYEYSKLDLDKRVQKRFALNSTLQWSNNSGSSLKLRGSLFNYEHTTCDLASNWDDRVYEMELSGTHMFSQNHLLTGGYHLERETIDDLGKGYEADQTIHSFYLQDEITYRPVTLVVGARIDSHDLWGETFNPKAGLKLDVSDNFKIRTSIGKAFRAPKLVKLYGEWNMGPFLVKPNQELEPETSVGFQVGGEWRIKNRIVLTASFFNQDVSDLITSRYNRTQRPWIISWYNVDKARIRGVDVSVKTAITRDIVLNTSYTYVDPEDKETGETILNRPKHSGSMVINWKIPSIKLGFNVAGHYTGSRLVEMEVTSQQYDIVSIDPFATMDLTVSKDMFSHVRLFLTIRNIFNKKDVFDEYNLDGTRIFGGFDFYL